MQQMEISVLYLIERAELQQLDFLSLPKDAFDSISGLTGSTMNFRWQVQYEPDVWTPFWSGPHTDISYFNLIREITVKKIDEILNLPHIADEDEDLVDVLPKIRDSHLFSTVKSYQEFGNRVVTPEFSRYAYDYYSYFVKLKKLNVCSRPVRVSALEAILFEADQQNSSQVIVQSSPPVLESDKKKRLPPQTPPS